MDFVVWTADLEERSTYHVLVLFSAMKTGVFYEKDILYSLPEIENIWKSNSYGL